MMSEPKPFASLSSGLLARKGAAKPAMRPQGYGNFGSSLEDLGWDDMGHPGPGDHVPSSISALTPAPGGHRPHGEHEHEPAEQDFDHEVARFPEPAAPEAHAEEAPEPEAEPAEFAEPVVLEQQRALEASFEPAPVVSLPRRKPAPDKADRPARSPAAAPMPARDKAAFTLRLDPDRHLRLRLACAITRHSAQQIVTGALDEYLSSLPELEALAEQVPVKAGKR
jgi:hypothetical protein